MNRTEIDALIALAGVMCVLAGAIYAFGFGAALILLGIVLLLLSVSEFQTAVMLTREEQEIARISYPNRPEEESYKAYAAEMVKCATSGKIRYDRRLHWAHRLWMTLVGAYRSYIINYATFSNNARSVWRTVYARVSNFKIK